MDASDVFRNDEVQRFCGDHGIKVSSIETAPYMGSDLIWIPADNGWDFRIYPPLYADGARTSVVLLALADIRHRSDPVYTEMLASDFNEGLDRLLDGNPDRERIAQQLVALDEAVGVVVLLDDLAEHGYLRMEDARLLMSWQAQRMIDLAGAAIYLGLVAVLRRHGGDISLFVDTMMRKKAYALLPLVDLFDVRMDARSVDLDDVVELYRAMDLDAKESHVMTAAEEVRQATAGPRQAGSADYDIAISFAGEDRVVAKAIADRLQALGITVFYDGYERADLWGKDLYGHLSDVYLRRAKYCLMLISEHYERGQWTTHERQAAQARAFEAGREYILPLRLDGTPVQGILNTTGFIDFQEVGVDEVVRLLVQKLTEADQVAGLHTDSASARDSDRGSLG